MRDFAPILITWLLGMLSNLRNFDRQYVVSPKVRIKHWHLAAAAALVMTGGAAFSAIVLLQIRQQKQEIPFKHMEEITEPSGGARFGDRAFIASDEPNEGVFEFLWKSHGQYDDPRKCSFEDQSGNTLPTPNDIEAAAALPGNENHLLLLTSHSNTKKGKNKSDRRILLEASLPPSDRSRPCVLTVKQSTDLRPAMLKSLSRYSQFTNLKEKVDTCDKPCGCGYRNENGVAEILQAEGLAIDRNDSGRIAYIGLRAPLVGGKAVILTTPVSDLFSDRIEFTVKFVNLLARNTQKPYYGISSLDFDDNSGKILILGTSESRTSFQKPLICSWSVDAVGEPDCRTLPSLKEQIFARPELLLFPTEDAVVTFLDGDNQPHGQVVYSRKELGL